MEKQLPELLGMEDCFTIRGVRIAEARNEGVTPFDAPPLVRPIEFDGRKKCQTGEICRPVDELALVVGTVNHRSIRELTQHLSQRLRSP